MAEEIKGVRSQAPPVEEKLPCRPLLPNAAHSLSRQSLPPKPTGQLQLKPPQRSEQMPLLLHGFESQKWSLAWQPVRGTHMEDMRHKGAQVLDRHRGPRSPLPPPYDGDMAYLPWCRCLQQRPPCPLGGHQCAGPACSQ